LTSINQICPKIWAPGGGYYKMVSGIIIVLLWAIISGVLLFQNADACSELSKSKLAIVVIIFMIGGPILAAAAILETILDSILPDGWNGDDDDDFKKY
jgi:hypothetical protein